MSSKRRSLKGLHAASEDENSNFTGPADKISPIFRNMMIQKKNNDTILRPAHSRIVNNSCLRPHGALHPGELEVKLQTHQPSESLLSEIMLIINNSQKLLRRGEDFNISVDFKDATSLLHDIPFRNWWLNNVAKKCLSASSYPFTSYKFTTKINNKSLQIEDIIRRILLVFAKDSNNSHHETQEILFHTLKNENASANGLISANYNSRHITVCCGFYFYRVEVLDLEGCVISKDIIAERLQAVKEHADQTERAFLQQNILPEALEDLVAFHKLLGNLTEINQNDCAAIIERLRGANPLNATSLDAIDAGIFTVILRRLDKGVSIARWYRSALVLEEEEEMTDNNNNNHNILTLRTHSILLHSEEFMNFIIRVLQLQEQDENITKSENTPIGTEETSNTETTNQQTVGMEQLEMWLPWKHRKPMHPYPLINPSPFEFPLSIRRENKISFSYICLSAVLAVQEFLTSPTEFPVVLIAFPNRKCALSARLLYSKEVEALIQAIRCGSALVEGKTIKDLIIKALKSLENVIDICYKESYPLYSMAKLLLMNEKATGVDVVADGSFLGIVDLYITVNMLDLTENILKCDTNLLLPSKFALTCSAISNLESKKSSVKKPSSAPLLCASLLDFKNDKELYMGVQLSNFISSKAQELFLLVSM